MKFKSVRSSIFAAVSALVLCAVAVVTVVSLRYTNSSIFENSSMYTQTLIRQLNQNIDSYITYMDNIAALISGGADAHGYLYQNTSGEDESGDGTASINSADGTEAAVSDSADRTEAAVSDSAGGTGVSSSDSAGGTAASSADSADGYWSRLVQEFELILKGRSDIRNIGIVRASEPGLCLFNTGTQTRNTALDITTQDWYTNAVGQYDESVLTSSHVQHLIKGERPWVITISRGVQNFTGQGESDGVVFIDLNYSAISELCDQNSLGSKGYIFILDQDGNIVYHPQQQQLYNELQTENIDLVMNAESDTIVTGSGDDEKMYAISRSEQTGWTVVGCMNMGELLKSTRQAQKIYLFSAVALVVVALILSSFIASTITRPIKRLRDSMERFQAGDFSAGEVEVSSENEIGSLTRSFNGMTRRIESLMEQNVYEQQQKRKIELKALQSQINPHFLYNTLDSIIWMAEGNKNEEVVLMTASLARLLRQSISNENEVVLISQEVEYVRNYLTIQKMRYKDKLEFSIYVDPVANSLEIVKLVLQPIVENAIYHGLKYKESRGMLTVKVTLEGENVVLEVADDGVGMDEETLSHIYERHKVNYHSNGVGVYNVQQRLQLYYGSDYGISYTSEKGRGTVATIVIPADRRAEHEQT